MVKLCPSCSLSLEQAQRQPPGRGVASQASSADQLERWVSCIEANFGVSRGALRFRNEQACADCNHSIPILRGTAGRTVVAEMIEPLCEPEFLEGVKRQDGVGLYRWFTHRSERALLTAEPQRQSARQIAIYKMAQGILDPRDVQARFGVFDPALSMRGARA